MSDTPKERFDAPQVAGVGAVGVEYKEMNVREIGYCLGLAVAGLAGALGCDDGVLHAKVTDVVIGDSTSSGEEPDTGVGDQTAKSTDHGADSTGETIGPVFTVKLQAERYDAFDFKDGERWWSVVSLDSAGMDTLAEDQQLAASAHQEAFVKAEPDLDEGPGTLSENLDPQSGAELGFDVQFDQVGRYYVWIRAYPRTGADRRIHAGLDGRWPASGRNLLVPDGVNQWVWGNDTTGVGQTPGNLAERVFLDVDSVGVHRVSFAMGDDGFCFDEWVMTNDPALAPW